MRLCVVLCVSVVRVCCANEMCVCVSTNTLCVCVVRCLLCVCVVPVKVVRVCRKRVLCV